MTPPSPPGPAKLRYRLILKAYFGLLALGQPLVWRYFRKRAAKDPRYMDFPEDRKGQGATFRADAWVHAVSMGEMNSAVPLVRLLLEAGQRVVTTHATPAGVRAAEKAFEGAILKKKLAVRYAPIDLPDYWAGFFEKTRPKVGLVMEMEFWPGMIEAAAAARVPLCLTNSQVPSKSFRRARVLSRLFGHPVARAAAVFAKSDRMAERFRALGARDVRVFGETRFDIAVNETHVAAGEVLKERLQGRPIVTLASVVAGEEQVYVDAIRAFEDDGDTRPLFIWVPRAPEAFDPTIARVKAEGFRVATRTEAFSADLMRQKYLQKTDVLVGNSFGEMFFYMSPADVVVVGGGFVKKGAHNVIEPLAIGKPVITGPSIWTIEYPGVEAFEARVLTISENPEDLAGRIRQVLKKGGDRAREFHGKNVGASERIVEAVRPLLEERS